MAKDKQWGSINSYFRNASLATINNLFPLPSETVLFICFFILIPWLEIKSGCNSLEYDQKNRPGICEEQVVNGSNYFSRSNYKKLSDKQILNMWPIIEYYFFNKSKILNA